MINDTLQRGEAAYINAPAGDDYSADFWKSYYTRGKGVFNPVRFCRNRGLNKEQRVAVKIEAMRLIDESIKAGERKSLKQAFEEAYTSLETVKAVVDKELLNKIATSKITLDETTI